MVDPYSKASNERVPPPIVDQSHEATEIEDPDAAEHFRPLPDERAAGCVPIVL